MWKLASVPKAIALLAFLLPWMTVSCQGQPMLDATGFELATGNIQVAGSDLVGASATSESSGAPSYWLLAALVLIGIGMAIVFLRDVLAAYASIATSALAIALIVIARIDIESSIRGEAVAGGEADPGFDPAMLESMVRVEWQPGFYLAICALFVAIAMAFLALRQAHGNG